MCIKLNLKNLLKFTFFTLVFILNLDIFIHKSCAFLTYISFQTTALLATYSDLPDPGSLQANPMLNAPAQAILGVPVFSSKTPDLPVDPVYVILWNHGCKAFRPSDPHDPGPSTTPADKFETPTQLFYFSSIDPAHLSTLGPSPLNSRTPMTLSSQPKLCWTGQCWTDLLLITPTPSDSQIIKTLMCWKDQPILKLLRSTHRRRCTLQPHKLCWTHQPHYLCWTCQPHVCWMC